MKRVLLLVLLTLLVVAGQVFGSATAEEEGVRAESTGPQYGGTLTAINGAGASDPGSPDIGDGGFWSGSRWLTPIYERPIQGDFEKFGPRGNGEYPFELGAFIPAAYRTGHLLESWEVFPDRVVWNVRPGIYWAGNRPDVMESRELTAQEMVDDVVYFSQSPDGAQLREMFTDIYATSKYSLTIEYDSYDVNLMYFIGYEDRALIEPPETRAAGASDWMNHVGTGPYMLEEYVVGSHMAYVKNPDYWKTTEIDGQEYELPFIERLMYPIMPDPNIQTAALRTGRLDFDQGVPAQQWGTLAETAPDLMYKDYDSGSGYVAILKTDEEPTSDVAVRQALMKGTDMSEFFKLNQVEGRPINWYPLYHLNPQIYVPLEELPSDIQNLFDYDVEAATDMLEQAGYPDGFSLEMYVQSNPTFLDLAELLADQWSRLGVELQIQSTDLVSIRERHNNRTFGNATMEGMDIGNPLGDGLVRRARTDALFNRSGYSNPEFDALADQMLQELDLERRNELTRQAAMMVLRDAIHIPLAPTGSRNYWWPWLKNYYGEYSAGDGEFISLLSHAWIDQDLKQEMGF